MQALVTHEMPQDSAVSLLMQVFREVPSVPVSLLALAVITVGAALVRRTDGRASANTCSSNKIGTARKSNSYKTLRRASMTTRTRYFVVVSLLVLSVGRDGPRGLLRRVPGRRARRAATVPMSSDSSRGTRSSCAYADVARRHGLRGPAEARTEPSRSKRTASANSGTDRHQHRNRHRPSGGVPQSDASAEHIRARA